MSYEYITKYDSPNYTAGRQGNKISEIVIHHWGVDGQAFMTPVNWLCRQNGASSAHYVVEAGKVACLVDCANTAWHAGNFSHNLKSIGIECRPEMSAQDLETVCELVADLYETYGVLPIVGHKDISATSCPGRYYSKLDYIKKRAIEIMNGKKPNEPSNHLYRVRKSWNDINSQIGAFKDLNNAKKLCDKNAGYKVYNSKGAQVYPQSPQTPIKKYKIGDHVIFSTCYKSSTAPNNEAIGASHMTRNHGTITKIVNAKNPYLLDNGLCWVNDGDIRGYYTNKKSNEQIAREVIQGLWGNGQDRRKRLSQAGYNPDTIQALVNKMM